MAPLPPKMSGIKNSALHLTASEPEPKNQYEIAERLDAPMNAQPGRS